MVLVQDDEIRPAGFKAASSGDQQIARFIPALLLLKNLDLGKIDRDHHAFSRMQAAKPRFGQLVNHAVILDRGFPAHPANQTDRFHQYSYAAGCRVSPYNTPSTSISPNPVNSE
jgi:hypothetical protein